MPDRPSFTNPLGRALVEQHDLTPAELWTAVVRARAAWARERHLPQKGSASSTRTELRHALEAYVRSLDDRGRPVPYVLRDELRLMRLLA